MLRLAKQSDGGKPEPGCQDTGVSSRKALLGMWEPSQKFGELQFAHLSRSDLQHGSFEQALGIVDGHAIQLKKHQGARQGCPLVSINEGVILAEVVGVRGCHLVPPLVQPLTGEGGLGLGERRFQEPKIPDTILSAIPSDLVGMDFDDLSEAEEGGLGQRQPTRRGL